MELCEACKLADEIDEGRLVAEPYNTSGRMRYGLSPVEKGVSFLLRKQCKCKKEED